jgi:hypothetical protein
MTDEFDLFQGDFISYSQLMSQMSLDPGDGTSGTQYDAPRTSPYDTHGPSTDVYFANLINTLIYTQFQSQAHGLVK